MQYYLLGLMSVAFFVVSVNSVWSTDPASTYTTKRGDIVQFEVLASKDVVLDDQEQMKKVFLDSFVKSYRVSGAYSNLSDAELHTFLDDDFESTLRPLLFEQPAKIYLGAKVNGVLVGYTLFEMLSDDTVYVTELAIASQFWRQGLGEKMTLYIADNNDSIRKVVLLTERINLQAQKFYESIGFQPSEYMHEGYSAERFCAYEKIVNLLNQ